MQPTDELVRVLRDPEEVRLAQQYARQDFETWAWSTRRQRTGWTLEPWTLDRWWPLTAQEPR